MDKGFEHAQAAGVAHGQQTRQHGLAVVTVILLDPLLDLLFERIELRATIGPRMGHAREFRMTQILAHRIPGQP